MATTNNTPVAALSATQALKLQLAGIQVERAKAQEYVAQLEAAETDIRQRLMTGSAPAPTVGRKAKTTQPQTTAKTGSNKKRKMTPEGRKALSEALKRRWAQRRAESNTTQSAAVPVPEAPSAFESTVQ